MTNRNREYIDFLKQKFDEYKFIEFISDLLNLSADDLNISNIPVVEIHVSAPIPPIKTAETKQPSLQ